MASLMMEKLREADLIVFNRCTDELAEVLRQRNLKMLNRRAEMYLEYAGDEDRMENYDNGLCPFDLSVPVLELSDDDYGFWYTDCMDNPERYAGKTVKFRGIVAQSPKFPHGMYAAGRFGMVCCARGHRFSRDALLRTRTQTAENQGLGGNHRQGPSEEPEAPGRRRPCPLHHKCHALRRSRRPADLLLKISLESFR